MAFTVTRVVPRLRIFDVAKAREFYLGYLGMSVVFEHRFGEDFPLFMGVSRDGLVLHLSEHHGDGSPGTAFRIVIAGLDDLHRELAAKSYRYAHPSIETTEWGSRDMTVIDPFGNRLTFTEPLEAAAGEPADAAGATTSS